ncbi:helix-turn-helix domain-containing protein [Lactobacillus xylocopicola]|uniref:HTH cro/C1-type domain-containing protein n=1 Tax=Lactobacillus xylocopicola TaxID=2976676 RepID=A0ABN6SPK9_9LACO|nr:helix-turn-helix transcriptional regulator [Lactobacillus xylocopicola]BDR61257.1 hypothetical protein KIM322_15180 [Lactobacillus xylocopicola]
MKTNELLKHYRLLANKTQKEWAGTAISPSFYSKIEKGLNRIAADDLINLLDYNGISVAEFFENINLEKSLQYNHEYELKRLINEAYYESSLSKLEHIKTLLEQGRLPNKDNLLTLVKGYIALVNNNIDDLDEKTKSAIRNRIFNISDFDQQTLATYCNFMRLYDLDSNFLIARKAIKKFSASNSLDVQIRVLGIITNLLFLCIENKRYAETKSLFVMAKSFPNRPELFFHKNLLLLLKNFVKYHTTGNSIYIDECQKSVKIVIFLGMPEYGKELERFLKENKLSN